MNSNPFAYLGWSLLLMAVFLAVLGVALLLAPTVPWLGRLPGDIRIEREGFRFYFPLTTCLLISSILSAIAWLVRLWQRL